MSVSTLTPSSTIQLPGNIQIPQLGFGVYLSPTEITRTSVTYALHAGYRHIDTAQIYRNEKQVGEAVRSFLLEQKGKVQRQDIWVTSKLRDEKGRLPKKLDNVPRVLRESIETICGNNPEMEGYVDLFLIHSPYAGADGRRLQWRGLEDLKREGKTRAIGVSNYIPAHQVVLYIPDSYILGASPLAQGKRKDDPVLKAIAEEVNKTWAQVVIRWSLQHGFIPLPKSDTPERIVANADVFDFSLTPHQMSRLDSLDEDDHVCWNPTLCV
ncbi:hypothetical protein QFC24_001973 [Naganishia onofrii]|uniref:Uncharacterized protein n=1 Tax=Naganishia onofrii TaxID=1851511 RepID=A0ACC2XQL0_9TREE|nr:hypothetical protein QFC24_001973 [Naganishia onofrii]